MKKLRIYLDTSVFGGYFDDEFATTTHKLFEEIREGRYILVVSTTNVEELKKAPEHIRGLLKDLSFETVVLTEEAETLRNAYIEAGVVGLAIVFDAEHIAIATVANVDLIISWNFKHIVNYLKIQGYNAINILNGYKQIQIYSPNEVIEK